MEDAVILKSHQKKFNAIPYPQRVVYRRETSDAGASTVAWLGDEHITAQRVAHASSVTYRVAQSSEILFELARWPADASESLSVRLSATPLGEALIVALLHANDGAEALLPYSRLNPLYESLRELRGRHAEHLGLLALWKEMTDTEARLLRDGLQLLVNDLREQWASGEIPRRVEPERRRVDMQWRAAKGVIQESFRAFSTVLAVRLTLQFGVRPSAPPKSALSRHAAHDGVVKFLRYLNDSYPVVRYIRSVENGAQTGLRHQLLILLDGSLVVDGVRIGEQMGARWVKTICPPDVGSFHCFNNFDQYGLGRIRFDEDGRIAALAQDHLARIVRTNFWIRYIGQRKCVLISQNSSVTQKRSRNR